MQSINLKTQLKKPDLIEPIQAMKQCNKWKKVLGDKAGTLKSFRNEYNLN